MQAVVPIVGAHVGGRPAVRFDADGDHPGVVDADVDTAGNRERGLDQVLGDTFDHQIPDESGCREPTGLQVGDAGLDSIRGRSDHDVGAVGRECLGAREADAVRTAGSRDDGDLVVESHDSNASTASANTVVWASTSAAV